MHTIEIIHAFSEPMRFAIIETLLEHKYSVQELSKHLKISESAISQHMRVLKKYNLVYGQKEGYSMYYRVNKDYIGAVFESLCDWIQQYPTENHSSYNDILLSIETNMKIEKP